MISLILAIFFQFQLIEKDFLEIKSFKAEFEQIYDYGSGEKIREKGLIYFNKPSLFRWEYTEPERKIFIVKGDEFFTYLPEDGIIQKEKITDNMVNVLSILTEGKLSEFFDLKEKECPPHSCVLLYPKERKEFNYIEIRYSEREIKEVSIKFDNSENRIILKKLKKNIIIPSDIFSLEVELK